MAKNLFLLLALFFVCQYEVLAQATHNHRTCGTMDYMEQQIKAHPEYAQRRAFIEQQTQTSIQNGNLAKPSGTIIIIPVVVHSVYKNATDSITMTDVLSQIDSLNKDYRLQNADKSKIPAAWTSIAGDFEIQFCLATKDPQGNPTTGVTYTKTTAPSFSTNDAIKSAATGGKDPWPSNQYLNMWVGELSGGLLGYATFPGGAANKDGVVIGANCFGSQNPGLLGAYNLGRTATHEIGHWLNLIHIWGDASGCNTDDLVTDTPVADAQNFGCPVFPFITSCQAAAPGEMTMNYMDYTDDACMYMFTNGQKARARALFDVGGTRESLLTSAVTACNVVPPPPPLFVNAGVLSIQSPIDTLCTSTVFPTFTLTNIGNVTLTTATIQYSVDGGTPISYNWTGSLDSLQTTIVNLPQSSVTLGNHAITITIVLSNGAADPIATNDALSQNFVVTSVAGQPMPFFEGFESAIFPANNIVVFNPDNAITWESTNTASALGNQSCRIRNISNSTIGAVDELQLPSLDWTNINFPKLEFDVAYANYTAGASDTLQILISTDCGTTYQSIAKLFGSSLLTTSATTSSFTPTIHQWKHKSFSLVPFAVSPVAKIIFRNISGYENNLYLDNINIYATATNILSDNDLANNLTLFPNPASDFLNIEYTANNSQKLRIEMLDLTGRRLSNWTENVNNGKNEWEISLPSLTSGVYLLRFTDGVNVHTEKIVIR